MNGMILPTPKNETAQMLLIRLDQLDVRPVAGFFSGDYYCLAIPVRNHTEAFALGQEIGPGMGRIDSFMYPDNRQLVVFRDALAQESSGLTALEHNGAEIG